jgi:hypothetical protein
VVVANAEGQAIYMEDATENLFGRTEVGKREEVLGRLII